MFDDVAEVIFSSLVPFFFIFIVCYFLLIKPQSKRRKEQEILDNLKKGDIRDDKEEEGGWGVFCTLGLMFCVLSFFIAPYIFGAIGIAFGVLGVSKEKSLGGLLVILVCAISIFLSYQATDKLQKDALQQSQQLLQQHQEWKKSIGLR